MDKKYNVLAHCKRHLKLWTETLPLWSLKLSFFRLRLRCTTLDVIRMTHTDRHLSEYWFQLDSAFTIKKSDQTTLSNRTTLLVQNAISFTGSTVLKIARKLAHYQFQTRRKFQFPDAARSQHSIATLYEKRSKLVETLAIIVANLWPRLQFLKLWTSQQEFVPKSLLQTFASLSVPYISRHGHAAGTRSRGTPEVNCSR